VGNAGFCEASSKQFILFEEKILKNPRPKDKTPGEDSFNPRDLREIIDLRVRVLREAQTPGVPTSNS